MNISGPVAQWQSNRFASGRREFDSPRVHQRRLAARRLIVFGGVCWTMSEPFLNKIPNDCRASLGRTKTERSGGQKERGLGCHPHQEFLPALAFVASFFAAAIFRISLCEMRRQGMLPLFHPPIRGQQ